MARKFSELRAKMSQAARVRVDARVRAALKKKRNPQDVTLRNVRAGLRRDRALAARLCALEVKVDAVAQALTTAAFALAKKPTK